MISQWVLQEIIGRRVQSDTYLCAAHVDVVGVLRQGAGSQVVFVQAFASAFDDGHVAGRQQALNADAQFGLEVAAKDELLGLFQSYGAVGQYYFVGTCVDHGRVGHECPFSRKGFDHQHGENRLQVAFASGNDAFVIQ